MWTRKYVLVGSLYFYGICRDEAFKTRILTAMKAHVDYLIATLGEGKLSVLETSEYTPREAAEGLAEALNATVVGVIGRKIILYRRSLNGKRHIEL